MKIHLMWRKCIILTFIFLHKLDADIYQHRLRILSDFALGDRYSNINILSKIRQKSDPILG